MPNFRKYYTEEVFREKRNKQRHKYYAKTAKYRRRPWTPEEDAMVLAKPGSDPELSDMIERSVQSIQLRRNRLKKWQKEGVEV